MKRVFGILIIATPMLVVFTLAFLQFVGLLAWS